MTLSLAAKQAVVDRVSNAASDAVSAVVADYRFMTVNELTKLRKLAREVGVHISVVKITLLKRALSNTMFDCLNEHLKGSIFIALSKNGPSDAARLLKNFVKTNDKLKVLALSVGDQYYPAEQLEAVASLPTKDEALSKLMFVIKAPIEKFVRTIVQPHTKLVRTIVAIKKQKAESDE